MTRGKTFPAALVRPGSARSRAGFESAYRESWRRGLAIEEPNPFFASRWYALHNRDWNACETPFDHFLRAGLREGRDPSPFVDFTELRRRRRAPSNAHLYAQLVAKGAGPSDGVYESVDELRRVQRAFLRSIDPLVLSDRIVRKRDNLVFVQNSRSAQVKEWLAHADRSFDVLSNHYDAQGVATSAGAEVRVFQVGTKFSAVARLVETCPGLLTGYRYVMLVDDDVELGAAQLDTAFGESASLGASLAQPALTHDSDCAWPDLYEGARVNGPLRTNTVEIMMPIVSGAFFERIADTFRLSVSGFGLDLLWGERLRDGETAWRLGTVTARHARPIDRAGGAYYTFLRANHINPRAELWSLIDEYGLRRSIRKWPTA